MVQRHGLSLVVIAWFALLATTSEAKIPSLDPGELQEESAVIVVGTVTEVLPVEDARETDCFVLQRLEARIAVERVEKGEAGSELWVRFTRKLEDNGRCDGGPITYSLTVGTQVRLYLEGARTEDGKVVHEIMRYGVERQ